MRPIIKRPILSEKAVAMNEGGKYIFEVALKSNKVEIKKAIEKMYNVQVEEVNTMKCQGKTKSKYTRSKVVTGRKSSFKKAIIQLAAGEMIDIYGNQ